MSVTRPTAWKAPRSASFVATAGIDIHAERFHRRGEQIPDRDRLQGRAHHHRDGNALQSGSHRFLRLDRIGNHIRQRAVISDGAGENKINAVLHTGVHDAALEQATRDRLLDAAQPADRVDRAEMILGAFIGERALLEMHAERSPKERVLDVMRRQRVAGEKQIDIAPLDQLLEIFAGPRVHDRRAADDENLALRLAHALKFPRHLPDNRDLRFLDRDVARHELEKIGARGRTLQGHDPNSLMPHDDFHPFLDVVKFGRGRFLRSAIDRDRAVHQGGLHLHFIVPQADEGLLVGRHVKALWENAIGGRRRQLHALLFPDFGAVLAQMQDQFVEGLR